MTTQGGLEGPEARDAPGLYVHVPFCATLCYYCACNKIVTKKREPALEYMQLIRKEIDLLAPKFKGRAVSQLHWGGGTPTFLDDNQVTQLYGWLREAFGLGRQRRGCNGL